MGRRRFRPSTPPYASKENPMLEILLYPLAIVALALAPYAALDAAARIFGADAGPRTADDRTP
jgi:hypothetical protein